MSWANLTPPGATGAIGIVGITADSGAELDEALVKIGLTGLAPGRARLHDILGVDTGIVARWSDRVCHLMPHGGIGVVRLLTRKLTDTGMKAGEASEHDFPEARSSLEARMLAAMSRAGSPLAIDLLLDQPRRWASGQNSDPALDLILHRLIEPPLVVALGAANVGKSGLVNALSGRAVSIVADEPGTTRDHVGVHLDLGGLVVRYLDTPGIRSTEDAIEREAQALSLRAAEAADLLLLMGDAVSPPPHHSPATSCLRVALRSDLGRATWAHDCEVSGRTGHGMAKLVGAIRERLVPRRALEDPRPWRFWNQEPAAAAEGATGLL